MSSKLFSSSLRILGHKFLARNSALVASTSRQNSYYVVLPEIPTDTKETNKFLNDEYYPLVNEIDPKEVYSGLLKVSSEFEYNVKEIVDNFDTNSEFSKEKFDEFFFKMEQHLVTFENAIKTARHLTYIRPYTKFMGAFLFLQDRVQNRKNERWLNKRFYDILLRFKSNLHLLNEQEANMVLKSFEKLKINGVHLTENENKQLQEIRHNLRDNQQKFRQKLKFATNNFSYIINDPNHIADIPLNVRNMISANKYSPSKGPWIVSLNDFVFQEFMKHCSDRKLRKKLYDEYYSRASYTTSVPFGNNAENVTNIIKLRKEMAKLLGYKSYTHLILETHTSANIDSIYETLELLRGKLRPQAEADLEKLNKFTHNNGFKSNIEIYDYQYWRNEYIKTNYRDRTDELMQYFPYEKVMSGLLTMCEKMFDLKLEETNLSSSQTWDSNVKAYRILDNGEHISTLFLDPFLRAKKINDIWSYSGRDSSLLTNNKPIANLMLNVRNLGQNSTMTFDQVKKLFAEFGNVLRVLLTRVKYQDQSEISNLEWDSSLIPNKVFENLIYSPTILKQISGHVTNGQALPIEYLNEILNRNSEMQSLGLLQHIYLSAFDLEAHLSDKFWLDIVEELWPRFVPLKRQKDDYHPCQFSYSFAQDFGASYFAHLWSDILSADVSESFKELEGTNDENMKQVFKKLRETYLMNGSSVRSNELFKRFRGRNPSINPFINKYTQKS